MSFKALICKYISYAVAIATFIYLCISCLWQDLTNRNLTECELFHTFNERNSEASQLHS